MASTEHPYLVLMDRGSLSNTEISDRLHLCPETVKTTHRSVTAKLTAHDHAQLARYIEPAEATRRLTASRAQTRQRPVTSVRSISRVSLSVEKSTVPRIPRVSRTL
ncbi:LuxR C-terminal-related transcriptional regulator [Streptomyces sp. CA-210063]|uniref:LuxR C-terminal-related transcriptional regulator n=1 Tax=Streptomyces sp. CA-210063 TaxID=2801029 RepID=UPI003FA6CA4C